MGGKNKQKQGFRVIYVPQSWPNSFDFFLMAKIGRQEMYDWDGTVHKLSDSLEASRDSLIGLGFLFSENKFGSGVKFQS